ncbi:MAG: hypothetical protein WBV67_17155 [Candidatus Cybelea sp.]|jgi:hypothetical protein
MARPPQYERDPDLTRDVTAVKAAVKRLTPEDRAQLLAWMLLYFQDDGMMFSPQISRRRQRITFDGTEFWLARVPKRR